MYLIPEQCNESNWLVTLTYRPLCTLGISAPDDGAYGVNSVLDSPNLRYGMDQVWDDSCDYCGSLRLRDKIYICPILLKQSRLQCHSRSLCADNPSSLLRYDPPTRIRTQFQIQNREVGCFLDKEDYPNTNLVAGNQSPS